MTFFIGSQEQFFSDVVYPQYENFKSRNSNISAAIGAIICTYHMYEWGTGSRFTQEHFIDQFSEDAELAEYFEMARKVSNGAKHANPRIETVTQAGFSSAFSSGFARPLNIIDDSGVSVSVDELLDTMIDFWKRQIEA